MRELNLGINISIIVSMMMLSSCSVISHDIRDESNPFIRFDSILENPKPYEGETIILAGYIIDAHGAAGASKLTVLQAPLNQRDEPKSKDYSQGRFIVQHNGFLDPEVYKKDRKITVAGRIASCEEKNAKDCHQPYLRVESREIYLWPEYDYRKGYDDAYPYPYRYRYRYGYGHRYHPHHHRGFYRYRYRYCR